MHTHELFERRPRLATLAAITCALLTIPALVPALASAQASSQLDARWQPWIGCWQPAAPPAAAMSFSTPRNSDAPLVCVIPATATSATSGVDVVTIANGKIVARDIIVATGEKFARSKDGCNGVESASWSADGHRAYVSSDFTCPGGLRRSSSGLFAISPTGEWVNVQGVNASGNKGVRTLHYTDAGVSHTLPNEISQALADRSLAVSTARAAAGARLTSAAVVDASRSVDSTVVEAWIIDRGQSFAVDAKQLVALADAGVPSNVTDAMVAVSYPKAFMVNRPSGVGGASAVESVQEVSGADAERSSPRQVQVMMMPAYSPYSYSPFGYSPFDYYGFGYSPYGYSPYGYSPYGYSPYGGYYSPYAGFGAAYGGLYGRPIIVLRGNEPAQQSGYVVKGRGYTRTAPGTGGSAGSTAEPRPTVSSPPPASSGNSAPASPPASQPASSGRTAHQRP